MQLSLYADFSCRTLIYLALLPPHQRSSIEEIARSFGVSTNHLVKVVHQLGQLGYVETTRGRGGGVRLAMPAQKISMGDVIRKTEPGFAIVECMGNANTCPITTACGLKPWLAQAIEAFLDVLANVTLADVVGEGRPLRKALGIRTADKSGI